MEEIAKDLEKMLENDMSNSVMLDVAELKAQSFWHQMPRRVARLFAPAL